MTKAWINLARSKRSRTFDEIIGQDLAVRLVKNSLYKQQLFPVYLLAGQRGCGKTTLGRVFAAAINCQQRADFIQKPLQTLIPCLTCPSCAAMQENSHPDFYEIDAASHTGVDHIRALTEGASFLPCLGGKKIYLIDEAHMLSKAAFNALLKMLEEPPPSVIFMLATTDPHKVIDTVRSRCFQLFLDPIQPSLLKEYLADVCKAENIAYEEEALSAIVYESEGSVRDALNCLERVRLAYEAVTYKAVGELLGDAPYDVLIELFKHAFARDSQELLHCLHGLTAKQFSPLRTWKKGIDIIRGLASIRYGILDGALKPYEKELEAIARIVTLDAIVQTLEVWCQAEPLFIKSQAQYALIEMIFLQIQQRVRVPGKAGIRLPENEVAVSSTPVKSAAAEEQSTLKPENSLWGSFLKDIEAKDDPLIGSIFKQALFKEYVHPSVKLAFGQDVTFFKELLEQAKNFWKPLLEERFAQGADISLEFTQPIGMVSKVQLPPPPVLEKNAVFVKQSPPVQPYAQKSGSFTGYTRSKGAVEHVLDKPIDVRDTAQWSKAHMILKVFPGVVKEERQA